MSRPCYILPNFLHSAVKINRGKPRENGVTRLTRVDTVLPQQEEDFLLPQQQPSQWDTVSAQPVKSHCASKSQFIPTDFLFITASPTSLFLWKWMLLSFVWQTCLWFCPSLLEPVAILCCSWINLFLLGEPGWLSWLSIQLLISAQVMISWFMGLSPT